MKKLFFALSVILLLACSSDDVIDETSVDTTKTYPVTFSVSKFTSEIEELRSLNLDDSNLKAYYLFITNQDSVYVSATKKINLTDLSSLKDMELKLPEGKYTAYSVLLDNFDSRGGEGIALTGENGYLGKKMSDRGPGYSYGTFSASTWIDTEYTYSYQGVIQTIRLLNLRIQQYDYFYKKTDFVVDEYGSTVNQVLPRVTGKLEFHFTDIKPLDNSVYPDSMYYAYINLNVYSGVDFRHEGRYAIGDPGFYITRKQWSELAEKPLTFYTRATGSGDYRLMIKIIDPTKPFYGGMHPDESDSYNDMNLKKKYIIRNVKVVENKRTIMTGALGIDNVSGFSVEVDDAWDDDIKVDF